MIIKSCKKCKCLCKKNLRLCPKSFTTQSPIWVYYIMTKHSSFNNVQKFLHLKQEKTKHYSAPTVQLHGFEVNNCKC